ncbi:conserved hypothetical protein, partial [Ricinus communis]
MPAGLRLADRDQAGVGVGRHQPDALAQRLVQVHAAGDPLVDGDGQQRADDVLAYAGGRHRALRPGVKAAADQRRVAHAAQQRRRRAAGRPGHGKMAVGVAHHGADGVAAMAAEGRRAGVIPVAGEFLVIDAGHRPRVRGHLVQQRRVLAALAFGDDVVRAVAHVAREALRPLARQQVVRRAGDIARHQDGILHRAQRRDGGQRAVRVHQRGVHLDGLAVQAQGRSGAGVEALVVLQHQHGRDGGVQRGATGGQLARGCFGGDLAA